MSPHSARTAFKVWADDERMPEGNKFHNLSAPPHWFQEHVPYAAELYGLERGTRSDGKAAEYTVHVLDTEGSTHTFRVSVARELVARVREGHRSDP